MDELLAMLNSIQIYQQTMYSLTYFRLLFWTSEIVRLLFFEHPKAPISYFWTSEFISFSFRTSETTHPLFSDVRNRPCLITLFAMQNSRQIQYTNRQCIH